MLIKKSISTLFILLVVLQGCGGGGGGGYSDPTPEPTPDPAPDPQSIVDVALANGSFTTLIAALEATDLDATLSDMDSTFTVFAPTDDAFDLLGQTTIDALLADTETLTDILTYHVITSEIDAAAAISSAGTSVEMANGDFVGLSMDGDNLLINAVTVTTTDVQADNGVIHVIDAVLIPPAARGEPTLNIVDTAVADGNFTTLVATLQATGLDATLADETSTFTVFAPTDDAFAIIDAATIDLLLANTDVLSEILLQHVVQGDVNSVTAFTLNGKSATTLAEVDIPVVINSTLDQLTFGGATVELTDIYTTNGIIHVIDTVVIADVALPTPPASIVDVAIANGSFNTLVAALRATGLDATLDNAESTFTVFAPTDAAFALLGQDTIDQLLDDTDTLSDILLYHVISDTKVLQDAALTVAQSSNNKVTMANGRKAALTLANSALFINKSSVSSADVMADNGVIHVVDQVIIPPPAVVDSIQTIADIAAANSQLSTLVTALTAADLVTTLSDDTATFTVFAPTNAAFDKIEDNALATLLADTTALTDVLLKHVVSGTAIDAVSAYAANGGAVTSTGNDSLGVALVDFTQTTNADTDEVAYDSANQMLVGGQNSTSQGGTLYVFDSDLGSAGSTCNGSCAETWPPVTVSDADVSNIAGLTLITREDGSSQAAYKSRPLYFYSGDSAAGDINGQDITGWWKVGQEQIALQIQGSNITTVDIYASNGVIHVIDTVITAADKASDTTAPVITLTGNNSQTVELNAQYSESGATADGGETVVIDATAVNTAAVGSYSVYYNATDAAGNAASQVTRTVNVVAPADSGAETIEVSIAANNSGSGNVYVIDGVQKKSLTFVAGTTYTFNHSSGHPLRFSETDDGTHGSGTEYTAGVDRSVSGVTTIQVTSGTPSTLYYYCSVHPGMGGLAAQQQSLY